MATNDRQFFAVQDSEGRWLHDDSTDSILLFTSEVLAEEFAQVNHGDVVTFQLCVSDTDFAKIKGKDAIAYVVMLPELTTEQRQALIDKVRTALDVSDKV